MKPYPVLKLQLEQMEQTILCTMNERHDDLKEMIQDSFNGAVDHIKQSLDVQVQAALSVVIADAVAQAAEVAAGGLADELAEAMADQVRKIVRARIKPTQL